MNAPEKEVQHRSRGEGGEFLVEHEGRRIAELTYEMSGGDAVASHTFVDPRFRGTPLAPSLVKALVDWARRERVKVVPECAYVKKVFARTPEYADVERQMRS
jgi:hypothetical protein